MNYDLQFNRTVFINEWVDLLLNSQKMRFLNDHQKKFEVLQIKDFASNNHTF